MGRHRALEFISAINILAQSSLYFIDGIQLTLSCIRFCSFADKLYVAALTIS